MAGYSFPFAKKFRFAVFVISERFETNPVVELVSSPRAIILLNRPSAADTVYHIADHVDILAHRHGQFRRSFIGVNPDGDAQQRG